jgi:hypothetical protein
MHRRLIGADGTAVDVIAATGVVGHASLRVAPGDAAAVAAELDRSPEKPAYRVDTGRPGEVEVDLPTPGALGQVLRRLLDAGIEPVAFGRQGARLSDAFLALTGAEREAVR